MKNVRKRAQSLVKSACLYMLEGTINSLAKK